MYLGGNNFEEPYHPWGWFKHRYLLDPIVRVIVDPRDLDLLREILHVVMPSRSLPVLGKSNLVTSGNSGKAQSNISYFNGCDGVGTDCESIPRICLQTSQMVRQVPIPVVRWRSAYQVTPSPKSPAKLTMWVTLLLYLLTHHLPNIRPLRVRSTLPSLSVSKFTQYFSYGYFDKTFCKLDESIITQERRSPTWSSEQTVWFDAPLTATPKLTSCSCTNVSKQISWRLSSCQLGIWSYSKQI